MNTLRKVATGLLLGVLLVACEPCPVFADGGAVTNDSRLVTLADDIRKIADGITKPLSREQTLIIADQIRIAVDKFSKDHEEFHKEEFACYPEMVAYYTDLKKKTKTGITFGQQ